MEENDFDIFPASPVRIRPSNLEPVSDAVYSSPFNSSLESVESPPLRPQYGPSESSLELKPGDRNDSVSSGTFGKLVRKVNEDDSVESRVDRVASARQRLRYNLMKIGPRRKSGGDRCEAWRKYLF